ncbi:conserved hypothetical protein [Vibrio phage 249E41-1]|nr:conserved hypothetical protein [Vibrio phage 249E41-1]
MNKLTIIFENCEDLDVTINHQVSFHIDELKSGYNLNQESCEMEKYTYFDKGYLLLPKTSREGLTQSDLSSFLEKEVSLDRITKYNDITSIHLPNGEGLYPSFVGESNNSIQKSYVTDEGNILVDWGDCFKNNDNVYFKSETEEEMLNIIDMHCNY